MSHRSAWAGPLLVAFALLPACSTPPKTRPARPEGVVAREGANREDEHDGWWSAYRERDGVTLAVSAAPAASLVRGVPLGHRDPDVVPLLVAVANGKLDQLTVTGESFQVIDDRGRPYQLTSWRATRRAARRQAVVDWFKAGPAPCFLNLAPRYRFTETVDFADEAGLSHAWAQLPTGWALCRLMVFERPAGPLAGRDFRLRLKTREMDRALVFPFRMD